MTVLVEPEELADEQNNAIAMLNYITVLDSEKSFIKLIGYKV